VNTEKISLENTIMFYSDFLRKIHSGETTSHILHPSARRTLRTMGVIARGHGKSRKYMLTEKAIKIMEKKKCL